MMILKQLNYIARFTRRIEHWLTQLADQVKIIKIMNCYYASRNILIDHRNKDLTLKEGKRQLPF